MSLSDKTTSQSLSPTLLCFIILICLFGLIPNSFAANYMRNNFDLSKIIYKTLLWCCSINVIGLIALLITALTYWLQAKMNSYALYFKHHWVAQYSFQKVFCFKYPFLDALSVAVRKFLYPFMGLNFSKNSAQWIYESSRLCLLIKFVQVVWVM